MRIIYKILFIFFYSPVMRRNKCKNLYLQMFGIRDSYLENPELLDQHKIVDQLSSLRLY